MERLPTRRGKSSVEYALYGADPAKRMDIAAARQAEMEDLPEDALDRIGLLLCHAASAELRERTPIDNDVYVSAQSKFERDIYGTEDNSYPQKFSELADFR